MKDITAHRQEDIHILLAFDVCHLACRDKGAIFFLLAQQIIEAGASAIGSLYIHRSLSHWATEMDAAAGCQAELPFKEELTEGEGVIPLIDIEVAIHAQVTTSWHLQPQVA